MMGADHLVRVQHCIIMVKNIRMNHGQTIIQCGRFVSLLCHDAFILHHIGSARPPSTISCRSDAWDCRMNQSAVHLPLSSSHQNEPFLCLARHCCCTCDFFVSFLPILVPCCLGVWIICQQATTNKKQTIGTVFGDMPKLSQPELLTNYRCVVWMCPSWKVNIPW